MQTIRQTITDKQKNVLNVYFTAGHPTLESTEIIIKSLAENGVDLIELGMPYSDPLADGPTIQKSSEIALKNGQSISNIFQNVRNIRKTHDIPIILMGYFNQMLQYGAEKFIADAHESGIQGLIIPDMPMEIYERDYKDLFQKYQMEISFLITPMTSDERIRQADSLSSAFLYVVSQSSITGKQGGISEDQLAYFNRIKAMNLKSPSLIGFGIHDKPTREIANQYSNGAIVGSAFIRILEENQDLQNNISDFINNL
ncbi:MAG: tryptophan synthase subunit alpha [Saprospiraceae bacterium]|nr:tryptophan synthase subunit alpha [Saprospiraceae bacterium]MBP6447771.1 tryptophan synthase subunit alpha [Saprospiraceae bacterium]